MPGQRIGYARVSSIDQYPERQLEQVLETRARVKAPAGIERNEGDIYTGGNVRMDIKEINRRLHEKGCLIVRSQVNSKGRMVHLIQPWNIAMFQEDIADILRDQATREQVIARNKGADLADPWPVALGAERV